MSGPPEKLPLAAKLVLAGLLVAIAAFTLGKGMVDPMNGRSLGPAWSCDLTRGAATFCFRDVPADLQRPSPRQTEKSNLSPRTLP